MGKTSKDFYKHNLCSKIILQPPETLRMSPLGLDIVVTNNKTKKVEIH